MGLHILNNFFQFGEVVDFIYLSGFGARHCEVLVQNLLVVDNAVTFYCQRHPVNLAVLTLQCQVRIIEILGKLSVGEIRSVFLPALQADRTVYVEQGGSIRFSDFRL